MDTLTFVDPPTNESLGFMVEKNVFSASEYMLSLLILIFGFLVMCLFTFLIVKREVNENQIIKLVILPLVIISSLFLITAGYEASQITPIIGLLGTIVGYLLGSNSNQNKE